MSLFPRCHAYCRDVKLLKAQIIFYSFQAQRLNREIFFFHVVHLHSPKGGPEMVLDLIGLTLFVFSFAFLLYLVIKYTCMHLADTFMETCLKEMCLYICSIPIHSQVLKGTILSYF